jgi:hypothetical protein
MAPIISLTPNDHCANLPLATTEDWFPLNPPAPPFAFHTAPALHELARFIQCLQQRLVSLPKTFLFSKC